MADDIPEVSGSGYARASCKGCGGPLSATEGQTVVMPTIRLTLHQNGDRTVDVEDPTGWCGDCIVTWDGRICG